MKVPSQEYLVLSKYLNRIWLYVISGEDKGARISVPIRHPEYTEEVTTSLNFIKKDMYIECTLHSDDGDYPSWRVDEIHNIEE